MANRKFSRMRIGQALGLLALALLIGIAGHGQQVFEDVFFPIPIFLTDANGWAKFQVVNEKINVRGEFLAVDRLKPTNNPQEKLMRNTQLQGRLRWSVEKKAPVWMELCGGDPLNDLPVEVCFVLSHADASQQDRPLFAGLTKFKIETQGGVTIIKSPLTDEPAALNQNVLYFAPFIVHELKLKVGETFALAPDALKQLANPLRNPVVRFNKKSDVADAKVIQKEGEVFGAVEFTGKTAGETIILIDYDMFSDIARVVLSQARLQVNVKVEQ